jgi:aminopeptidase-like protein
LRPDIGEKDNVDKVKTLMNIISYCDGKMTILEIADKINETFNSIYPIIEVLVEHGLLKKTFL